MLYPIVYISPDGEERVLKMTEFSVHSVYDMAKSWCDSKFTINGVHAEYNPFHHSVIVDCIDPVFGTRSFIGHEDYWHDPAQVREWKRSMKELYEKNGWYYPD